MRIRPTIKLIQITIINKNESDKQKKIKNMHYILSIITNKRKRKRWVKDSKFKKRFKVRESAASISVKRITK